MIRPEQVFGAFVAVQAFLWLTDADHWTVLVAWDRQGWLWVTLLWIKNVTLALGAGFLATWLGGRLPDGPAPRPAESLRNEPLFVTALFAAGIVVRWLFWNDVPPGPWVDTVFLVNPVLRDPGVSFLGASFFGGETMRNSELVSHVYARFASACFHVFGRGDAGFFAVSAVPGCIAPVAIWLLAREAAGPRVALAALSVAALGRWPVLFSRWAFTGSALVPLVAFGAALALRSARRKSAFVAGLSGVAFGLALHTHSSSWAVVPVFGALAVVAGGLRPAMRGLVASGLLGAGLAAAPFLLGYIRNPASLGGRAKDIHAGTRVRDVLVPEAAGAFQVPARLAYNSLRYTGSLLWTSDPNPRHGLPGAASFTPPVGLAALLGLFAAARCAARRGAPGLVLCALACGAIGAGILSNPEGAPNTLRSCVLVVPAVIGAGFVLERGVSLLRRVGVGPVVASAAALTFLFVFETLPVLTVWAEQHSVAAAFCRTEAASARLYRALDDSPLLVEAGTVRFPIALESLAGPEDPRIPVPRIPAPVDLDSIRDGIRRPTWLLARRGAAERLRATGLRVSRPVGPTESDPGVVLLRVLPAAAR